MKKKIKKTGPFKYLNPRNLQKEVHMYGYNFSWKAHLLVIFLSMIGVMAIGYLFKLKILNMVIVGAAVLAVIPLLVIDMYKRMYEHKRFADVSTYLEQMLYSFQKGGKILYSLRETEECFDGGEMRDRIRQAIKYIEAGQAKTEKGLLKEGLEIIEATYNCKKMYMVHELMISSEDYGGDVERSILIAQEDLDIWKRRVYRLQNEKKVTHNDNVASILMSIALCAVTLYILDYMKIMFDVDSIMNIFTNIIVQATSTGLILISIWIYLKSNRMLTQNWLENDGNFNDELVRKEYVDIIEYDEGKEKKKSLIWAAPFFIASIPVAIFFSKAIAIICIIIGGFMLLQHRVGMNIARKDVINAMYIAFPQWLMDMAMLLQNNNVQVSIQKSMENAPAVLQEELIKLLERLRTDPDKLSSYTDFCAGFDVPETQSCMKMLYSISESGVGNAQEQINNLLKHIGEMQDAADKVLDENTNFKMKLIFNYPTGVAAAKMLIDMTVGMVLMFQLFGAIGG